MQKKMKKKLSLLLALVLIVSLFTGGINATAADTTASCLAFSSDVHYDTDYKQNNLDVWLKNIQKTGAANHINYMGFCGDMGSAYDSGEQYWKDVKVDIDLVDSYIKGSTPYIDKAEYTLGNHEWFTNGGGNYGYYSSATNVYPEAKAVCDRYLRIGESTRTDNYIVYCFGSYDEVASGDSSKYGFGEDDINTLSSYLLNASKNYENFSTTPVFIMSHYPLQSFGGRNSVNADKVVDLLNNYPNVVFIWGHNHNVFDANYDMVQEAGDTVNVSGADMQIKFTSVSAGCMSDSEYTEGSHFVMGKGLIVKITGHQVNFTHYDMNGNAIKDSKTIDMSEIAKYSSNYGPYSSNGPYIVKFKDGHTNQMISYQTIPAGGSATEPAHAKYDGYIYTGWDKPFSNISQNITVTATYQEKPEPLAKQAELDKGYVYITLYEGDKPAVGTDAYNNQTPIVLYSIKWEKDMTVTDAVTKLHEEAYPGGTAGLTVSTANGFECYSKIWGHAPVYNTLAFNNSGFVKGETVTQGGDVYYLLAYDGTWITTSFTSPNATETVAGKYITMRTQTMNMNSDYTYTPKGLPGDIYAGTSLSDLKDTGVDADDKGYFTLSFDQPGLYYVVTKASATTKGNAVAMVKVNPNTNENVYVNLSIDGSPAYDQEGNYIVHYPMVLKPGDTINDIMAELHAHGYGKGSAWTSYEKDGATVVTCIWGLDLETNCANICLNSGATPVNATTVLKNGDVLDINGYSGAYKRTGIFDVKYAEIPVGGDITLQAMSAGTNVYSSGTTVYSGTGVYNKTPLPYTPILIDLKNTNYVTDADGKVNLHFDADGTHIITASATSVYSCSNPISVIKVGSGGPMIFYQIPVSGISGVPTNGIVGTPLTLSANVAPAGATFKTITWSVKSGDATITGGKLTATASGTVVITATIKNGIKKDSTDFAKDFTVYFSKVSTGTQTGTVYFYAVLDADILKDTGGKQIVNYAIPICSGDTIGDAITKLHQQAFNAPLGWGCETIGNYGLCLNKLWGKSVPTTSGNPPTSGGGIWSEYLNGKNEYVDDFKKGTHANVTAPAVDGMKIYLNSFTGGSYNRCGFFDKRYAEITAGDSLTLTFKRSSGDGINNVKLCTGAAVSVDGVSAGTTDSKTAAITLTFTTPGLHLVTGPAAQSWATALCLVNVKEPSFVAVDSVKNVPTSGIVGTALTLPAEASPANATNKAITWEVTSGVATLADGNKLTATAPGDVVVKATVKNGLSAKDDFVRSFTITFTSKYVAVSDIDMTGIPTTGTVGTPLTLTGSVTPSNATNKTIVWSVKSGSAAITGGNQLTATAAGNVVVTATIINGATSSTNFTKDLTINFTASGGGGTGGGGSSGGSTVTSGSVQTTNSGNTTTSSVTVNGTTSGGTTSASIDSKTMGDLIKSSQSAERTGKSSEVLININTTGSTDQVSLKIPAASLGQLVDNTNAALTVNSGIGSITFGADAVDSIKAAAGSSDVSISIKEVNASALSAETRQQVGDRPVYDFSVTAGSSEISSFGGSTVTVSVPYTLAPGEDPNGIVIYHISSTGELIAVPNCVYDPLTHQVTFTTTHFSKYAVIYKDIKFADVAGWSKDYINYLAARGIITGSGNNVFDPDGNITRAQFVKILANLAGADLSKYKASSFNDVRTTDWYCAAVQWASENSLVLGSNGNFNPNDNITRQDLAVILTRYAAKIGYALPDTAAAAAFTDSTKIASYATEAVKDVQTAGIISGYSDGSFGPLNNTTRAEAAKMIAVFIQGMVK